MKREQFLILLFGLVLLLSVGVFALSITGPTITPLGTSRPTIEDEIVCSWTPSADTFAQNITWSNGSLVYSGPDILDNTTNQSSLAAGLVRKGETWTCNVSSSNQTHSDWSSTAFTIKNALPSVANVTSATLYEDQTFLNTVKSTDPDGDNILYSLLGGVPSFCSLGLNDGALVCTPVASDIGAVNATFYSDDGGNYTAKNKVTYTVVEVNDPPSMSITNPNATEDILFNLTIDVSDEEDNFPINFSMNSNLSSLMLVNTSQSTAYITFNRANNAPSYLDRGLWSITINISDAGPTSDTPYDNPNSTVTVLLNVDTVNIAPNITTNLALINASQGDFLNVTINASDRDVEDTLTFSINSSCADDPWTIVLLNGSTNGSARINQTITNDHIICRDVSISVSDGEATDMRTLTLNLTNTNDAPTLYDFSVHPSNTGGNNMSNLSSVKGITFVYVVNVTDPDSDTYEGEVLSFTDNTSFFNIDSAGIISFTPSEENIGNHSILINVSDDDNLWSSQVMSLEVLNNTAPTMYTIDSISCREDVNCQHIITAYDPDSGDSLSFTSNNTDVFNLVSINSTSAQVNYVPVNAQVGNYTIFVNVTDQHGTTDSEIFVLSINNTNDAPIIDQNSDGNADNITIPLSVELYTTQFRVNVTDEDLEIGLDNLTFNYSFLLDDHNLSDDIVIDTYADYAVFSFTPLNAQVDNYTINISVSDSFGQRDWREINFTVLPRGTAPVINFIRPYLDGSNNTQTSFVDATIFSGNSVSVNFSENTIVTYDAKSTYDSSIPSNSMTYYWYVDGVLNDTQNEVLASGGPLNITYDYFDQGVHNVTLIVEDERYSQTSWYWNTSISNVNRPPVLVNGLNNISINTTITLSDYFSYKNSLQRFYDPDDDLNSDGDRSVTLFSETTNLTYGLASGYNCSLVETTFNGDDLSLTPLEEGTCLVKFTATDSYNESVDSGIVWLIVTDVVVEQEQIDSPSSGGGGSSRTRTRFIPFPFEVPEEYPNPVDLIVPQEVTIYENQTVEIPISLENKWNNTLEGIRLSASSSLNHTSRFDEDYFESLPVGANASTTLYIDQYRLESPYSITIIATVDNPAFNDTAIVMINALEKKSDGDSVESRVTFARDLLNDNPECQELNELLGKAEEEGKKGNAEQSIKLINTVVQGCKHLVNQQIELQTEQPKSFYSVTEYVNKNLSASIILGTIILILLGFGVSMIITGRSKKLEE